MKCKHFEEWPPSLQGTYLNYFHSPKAPYHKVDPFLLTYPQITGETVKCTLADISHHSRPCQNIIPYKVADFQERGEKFAMTPVSKLNASFGKDFISSLLTD